MEANEYIERVVKLENLIILFVAKLSGLHIPPEDTYELLDECDTLSRYIEEDNYIGYLSKFWLNLLGDIHGRLIIINELQEKEKGIADYWASMLSFADSQILSSLKKEDKMTMNINFWQQLAEKNQIEENNL